MDRPISTLDLQMVCIGTVSSVFAIPSRGIGLLFEKSPETIAHRPHIEVMIKRPDGTLSQYSASPEFCRKLDAPDHEVVALAIRGIHVADVPVKALVYCYPETPRPCGRPLPMMATAADIHEVVDRTRR